MDSMILLANAMGLAGLKLVVKGDKVGFEFTGAYVKGSPEDQGLASRLEALGIDAFKAAILRELTDQQPVNQCSTVACESDPKSDLEQMTNFRDEKSTADQ